MIRNDCWSGKNLGEASVISFTERQTENYINLTIIKTVFCDSHFSTITECCYFHYIFMQNNLDFYDSDD